MASIRAGFVTLRPAQADAELPAELRFAPELELRLLGEEARGGVLSGAETCLALRRERTGVYCTAATGELSFEADEDTAELPFRLLLEKSTWAEGVLTLDADGAPRLRLASASPAPAEGGVELELVLLVSSGGPPQAVAASLTLAPALSLPLLSVALPGAFLRTSSGRGCTLEPIDEDVGVALPLPRRPLGHQPFLGSPPASDEPELRFFSSGGCESDADMDDPGAELTWFSAGLRVGMGVGLGACLGVGLGLGILLSSYQRASRRLGQIKDQGFGLLK